MDLLVEAHVFAVGIVEDIRVQQRTVQSRVEGLLLCQRAAGDLDPTKELVPGACRPVPERSDAPTWALGQQVGARIGDADERQAHLHADHAVGGGIKGDIRARLRLARGPRPGLDAVVVPGAEAAEGPVEAGDEIEPVGAAGVAEMSAGRRALDLLITHDGRVGAFGSRRAAGHFEDQVGLTRRGEGELTQPGPGVDREFDTNGSLAQGHGVTAG